MADGNWLVSAAAVLVCFSFETASASASEVVDSTRTQVIVREHPKTGKPYASIVSSDGPIARDPFTGERGTYSRPDYRMLDESVKPGEIPYDGPWSDRKKVYLFAASLMTVGTVGGAVGIAAAPAAGGAAAGSGGYLAAGSVVAGGATAAAVASTRSRPGQEPFELASESRLKRESEGAASTHAETFNDEVVADD